MATRFYVTDKIRPADSFALSSEWDLNLDEPDFRRRRMFPWRSAFEFQTTTATETSATANLDGFLNQFVSPPLAAQTITGTAAGVFMARENATGADMRSQFIARVIGPDGTVRGTLVGPDTGGLANEWITSSTAWRSARFPKGSSGTSVTSVAALDGDKLVIEVGWRVHNTVNEAGNAAGTIRFGGGVEDLDIPQNDTTTTNTTAYPWIEFSHNFTWLDTPLALSDSIAGAPDAMPDPNSEIIVQTTAFDTFTNEADDPTEFEDWTGTTDPPSGWMKLTAVDYDSLISLHWTAGFGVYPTFFIYDEVPTASSATSATSPVASGYNPSSYDYDQPVNFVVPEGETWYVGVIPGTVPSGGTWYDTNFEFLVRRVDGGAATGDIKDNIADAVDCFPATVNTETETETTGLQTFTTEADDPTDITDYTTNAHGYTGWMKLVVPTTALVTISVVPGSQPSDLIFFLYDEVPTAASVAVHFNDYDDPEPSANWPYLPEMTLAAGTYYLMVGPWEGDDWNRFEGGYVNVKVRWEQAPVIEDFSMDAVIFKTNTAPDWVYIQPTLVDSVSGTVNDATSMDLTIPGTAAESDIFLIQASVDSEAVAQTVSMSLLLGAVASGNTLTALGTSTVATNNHILQSRWCRWNGTGDTIRITSTNSTAKAAVLSIWRDAGTPVFRTSTNVSTVILNGKTATSFGALSSDPNYGKSMTMVNAWAGGRAGITTWTLGTPQVEIEDVSATANASLVVGYRTNTVLDNFVEPVFATPSAAEFTLIHTISIVPASYDFTLRAVIIPGFPINAFIREVTHTTHLRTGPHTGTHLDTAVVTSALLGSLPAGTDLNTVLADLDAQITDLENQA